MAAAASDRLTNANNFYRAALGVLLIEGLRWRYSKSGSNKCLRIGERYRSPQDKEWVANVVYGSCQSWLPRGQAPWRAVAKANNAEEFVSGQPLKSEMNLVLLSVVVGQLGKRGTG